MSAIRCVKRLFAATLFAAALPAMAQIALEPCHLKGIEREVRCGRLEVPENPAAPEGRRISLRVAVVPALAKRKAADPLFVFAGGPGQAATSVAGQMQAVFGRINARRDLVFLDQRGCGSRLRYESAPPQPTQHQAAHMTRQSDRPEPRYQPRYGGHFLLPADRCVFWWVFEAGASTTGAHPRGNDHAYRSHRRRRVGIGDCVASSESALG